MAGGTPEGHSGLLLLSSLSEEDEEAPQFFLGASQLVVVRDGDVLVVIMVDKNEGRLQLTEGLLCRLLSPVSL